MAMAFSELEGQQVSRAREGGRGRGGGRTILLSLRVNG